MRSQLSRFFSFLEQRLEWLALAGASLSMVGLYLQYDPALGMVVVLFSTLAFFYLASGVLVLLDRANVERVMRLTWFLGMWGLSLLVIGMMSRLLFWESARMAIMAGGATVAAVLGFSLLNRMGLKGELRSAYDLENKPLMRRLAAGLLFGAAFLFSPDRALYQTFGPYRDDPEYVNLLMNHLADTDDHEAEAAWKSRHAELSR